MQQALGQESTKAPKDLASAPGDAPLLAWQSVWDRARAQAPDIAMSITAPKGPSGVWRADSFDRSRPTQRFSLALDARSGDTLFSSGWDEQPLLAQATGVGIPFHRGEFGVWNQAVLALAALAAVFSVVSGLVMWWQRRPRGRMAAPPLGWAQLRQAPVWLWAALGMLGWTMPLFAWSAGLLVVLETARLLRSSERRGSRPAPG